ncbi:MAG: hypothetical protein ACK4HB_06940, partial [Candidatus Bipolaricaulia bacterium]
MKHVWVLVLLVLSLGEQTLAQPLETLIIDETKTLEGSVCVELLAWAMVASGLFALEARFDIPLGPNPSGKRFDLIVIIPEKIPQIWLITADIPVKLPEPLQKALLFIKDIVAQIHSGAGSCTARRSVDVADD